jgi:hypothetical protein
MKGKPAERRPEPPRTKAADKADSTAPVQAAVADPPEIKLPISETSRPMPEREAFSAGVERLAFKIIDGKIDPEGIRKSNETRVREIVRASITDPKFRQWAGLEGVSEAAMPELVSPPLVGNLLDLMSNVECFMLAKKSGLPYEEVQKIIAWTRTEHDGRNGNDGLDAQGARLANKYIPPEWLARVDLWLFLGTVVTLSGMKIQMLNAHTKKSFERITDAPSHDEPLKKEVAAAPVAQPEAAPSSDNGAGGQSFEGGK